jgi:23S rRNA (pseudouridine1915-N3)-methyltransferase
MKVIVVGRTKEKYLQEGIAEYAKRIGIFTPLKIVELKDSNLEEEGGKILKATGDDYVIALDVGGRELSSEEFAAFLKKNLDKNIAFVIGGAEGLSGEVLERADYRLSLSKMTYTHEMARLIFLEQLYRAYTIIGGRKYHK